MYTTVWAVTDVRCDMNIQCLNGRSVTSRSKPVQVQAIGFHKLQFVSDLKLPRQDRLILGFRVKYGGQEAFSEGRIAEVEEAPYGAGYRYTVTLTMRSASDISWRNVVGGVAVAQQEHYEKIEKLYQRWQLFDFSFGSAAPLVDARR
ncbi:hypothetical protein ACFFK0_16245 [Paenibacillus chartarius]|uniref:Uncharacterized protein n=1 Tax=Paenibacillus chartarius TaxID=747481 RepID=A0ABV6DMY0_9BACL